MLQKPFSASYLKYVVEPAILCAIFSRVGALFCLQMRDLCRFMGPGILTGSLAGVGK